ncbi:SDR family oxidoreductase [Nocardioides mangrovicus]|uniref:SDR family oxidoreductase n=1 Tax=Nocardioides mangrovicus TaxID=2478913 RepID=A0A3L8NVU3_9ACTN|nr:SDR family NAD(P)-dependent oxidoreductase [Nocardioides mangrovicus]RLV47456.1 SDR family oxidoreductase [Nocardioides mangrovicus]
MTPLIDLSGRAVVVTGGNDGIGLGVARGLVRCGARVAVLGRRAEANGAAVAELCDLAPDEPGAAVGLVCDVGSEEQVVAAFRAARDELGPIRGVVACAGAASPGTPFLEQTLDDWRPVMRTNLEGAFLTFREAARAMVADGVAGSLVAVASLAATQGQVRGQQYAASKGGIVALARSCAVELARHGIRANTIVPGAFTTRLSEPFQSDERYAAKVLPRIPLRRWGAPDEVAGVAAYLVSDAAAYHSGDVLTVDGGYSVF